MMADELTDEVKRLRKALSFYAANWESVVIGLHSFEFRPTAALLNDFGNVARFALMEKGRSAPHPPSQP